MGGDNILIHEDYYNEISNNEVSNNEISNNEVSNNEISNNLILDYYIYYDQTSNVYKFYDNSSALISDDPIRRLHYIEIKIIILQQLIFAVKSFNVNSGFQKMKEI